MEPTATPFDLSFRIFGISVRVHPLFWLVMALLGSFNMQRGPQYLILWVACGFVSVLIHEMGHVLMGRVFGTNGHIWLYGFGGLAIGSSGLANRWQRVAVYLAGPGAQFALLIPLVPLAFTLETTDEPNLLHAGLSYMLFINIAWPILNLFPIWPLDGGKVAHEIFDYAVPENGTRIALIVSIAVAGVFALVSLTFAQFFMMIFFLMLAADNFRYLQSLPPSGPRQWQ